MSSLSVTSHHIDSISHHYKLFNEFFVLFSLFWWCWVFVEVSRLSLVVVGGLRCPSACGILVPQPGMEPVSPALEGGLSVTGPPGEASYMSSKGCTRLTLWCL